MFSNPQTCTRIILLSDRTIVLSRIKNYPYHFRIYIDGTNNGVLMLKDGKWTHTSDYALPEGFFSLLVQRIGITGEVGVA